MFASPSDRGDDGSPPPSLCKDKGVMGVALLSFWGFLGNSLIGEGYP